MKIVVVSPHPDDETLGAGGFIAKHKSQGDEVYWMNMTDVKENQGWSLEFIKKRRKQIEDIISYFAFDGFFNLELQPAMLENLDKKEIIYQFNRYIQYIQPAWIVLPNPHDAHTDHLITYEVGMSVTKVFRCPSIKKIMTMEILSESDFSKNGEAFSPNYFVDITDYFGKKIEALKIYNTEIGVHPFPRSIEGIEANAVIRGISAGCRYAEAFKIIKEID